MMQALAELRNILIKTVDKVIDEAKNTNEIEASLQSVGINLLKDHTLLLFIFNPNILMFPLQKAGTMLPLVSKVCLHKIAAVSFFLSFSKYWTMLLVRPQSCMTL